MAKRWRRRAVRTHGTASAQPRELLQIATNHEVKRELLVAVAMLHRRASCAAFDVGNLDVARQHVLSALELVHEARHPELEACLFYCAGRMEFYHGPPETALKLFQFGQPTALSSALPRLRALLQVNEARAYAKMGMNGHAQRALSSAMDLFHEGNDDDQPEWLRFFNAAELYGAAGIVWSTLADEQRAIAAIRKSLAVRPEHAALYRSFDMAELAACHVRNGDIAEGLRIGTTAVQTVEMLQSRRARARLTPY